MLNVEGKRGIERQRQREGEGRGVKRKRKTGNLVINVEISSLVSYLNFVCFETSVSKPQDLDPTFDTV